jgi:hypothetical protein
MLRIALILALTLAVTGSIATATIIRVPSEYPTIQSGIDAAVDGDTVLVADGHYLQYTQSIYFRGKAIVVMSENGPEVTFVHFYEIRGFVFDSGEDTSSVLQGFTISGALGDGGGGVRCYYSSPTIRNNIITENAAGHGGGIDLAGSSAIVEGNVISDNFAITYFVDTLRSGGFGGGISIGGPSAAPIVRGNIIARNSAELAGGGIYLDNNHPATLIEGNLILENQAVYRGAGVYIQWSSANFTQNTVSGNKSSVDGAGICCRFGSTLSVLNCILWADSAGGGVGHEIYEMDGAEALVTYSDIQGGWEGEGNIDADPLFLLPDKRDYRLLWDSPCIDTGHPDSLDPDGTRSDMGAFYFDQSTPITIYLTPDTTVYHRKENLGVTYTVINIDPDPVTFSLRTDVYLPNGKPYPGNPVVGPKEKTLPGGKTKQQRITHYIPGNTPFGVFTYTTTINSLLSDDILDEDSFRFVIEE